MSQSLPAGQGPYQSGNPITLEALFVSGTSPVDPDTVVFNLRLPDDTLVTYTFGTDGNVTNPSVGEYLCALPTTWLPGQTYYEAVATSPDVTLPGEFYVIPSSVIPPVEAPGPVEPPCAAWLAGEDLVGLLGSNGLIPVQLDAAAVVVSMLSYNCFGRRWQGICGPITVRPVARDHGIGLGWGVGTSSWWTWGYWTSGEWGGYGYGWGGEDGGRIQRGGVGSTIELAGYPATEITQIMLEGQVMAATFTDSGAPTYRLDEWRYLTRLSDPANPQTVLRWPYHQRLDLPDTSEDTWSVSFRWGVAPPPPALEAAKQLASNVMLAMNGQACQLPANVRSAVRQGASFERIVPLAEELKAGATGMFLWDAAIAAYNPYGLRRVPSIWSPDMPFPVRVGAE